MCDSPEHTITLSAEELQVLLTALGVRASFVQGPAERTATRALASKLAEHLGFTNAQAS